MKIKKLRFIIIPVILLCVSVLAYSTAAYLKKFDFNDTKALDKWAKMIFNGQVDYRLMKYGSEGFLRALSYKNCSAIYYRIGFNTASYPLISWKWRALKFPDKSKVTTEKDRDDYVARIYVIFPFLNFSSSKFIEYVWDEKVPAGTIMDSPVSKNIKQIVVRSGPCGPDEWVSEERNIYEDYIKVFGKKPGLSVGAIAIMCDADHTKSEAASLFSEITIANTSGIKKEVGRQ